jgi:hypothetical protein
VRRKVYVAKRLWSVAAEFLDKHLTVALITPLARLDDLVPLGLVRRPRADRSRFLWVLCDTVPGKS